MPHARTPRLLPQDKVTMQQQLLSLHVDAWLVIMRHLSLADLVPLHTALAPATPVPLSVIKRFAVTSWLPTSADLISASQATPRVTNSEWPAIRALMGNASMIVMEVITQAIHRPATSTAHPFIQPWDIHEHVTPTPTTRQTPTWPFSLPTGNRLTCGLRDRFLHFSETVGQPN